MNEWPEDRAIKEMDDQAAVALLKLLAYCAVVSALTAVVVCVGLLLLFHVPLPRY